MSPDRLKKLFQRSADLLRLPPYWEEALSYSQAGQDMWVYGEVFNELRGGFFVDLGAFDGVFLSNTYLLEKRYGWTGVCIEANPVTFKKLVESRSVLCVSAFVSNNHSQTQISNHGTVSTQISTTAQPHDPNVEAEDSSILTVRTRTLVDILKQANAPSLIQYISVDIEGAEDLAFENFDFSSYTFQCMTIERPSEELRQKLQANGYCIVKEIPGLDTFFIHRDSLAGYAENIHSFYMGYRRIRSH